MRFDEAGHPLWVFLAQSFLWLTKMEPARACNLLSAILSALALWPAFRIMRRLGASEAAASIACLALAVSHTYWLHAVITEVYALNSLIMLALLDLVTRDTIDDVALFAAGLGCAIGGDNHNLVFLWVPGLAWILFAADRRGGVTRGGLVAAAAGFALGIAPYVWLRAGTGRVEGVSALASRLLGLYLSPAGKLADLARFAGYLLYQFPTLVILVAAVFGVRRLSVRGRDDRGVLTGLALIYLASAGFAFSYPAQDRFAFFLPSYLVVAIVAAPGLDAILDRAPSRRVAVAAAALVCVVAPPVLYRLAPLVAGAIPEVHGVRSIPGRDAALYHLYPGKRGDDGARRYCDAAFAVLPSRALLVADDTLAEPFDYVQVVERRRTDVEVMYLSPSRQLQVALSKARLGRAVFLAARDTAYYALDDLAKAFEIAPVGPIFELRRKSFTP
ncbi:MAG TPA: DUF2723 domain-containing protein [Verrucomicrobiae bacterium]|nr:DUF2723 domain-containing protein [Verrucomicrobiae bacterium]